MSEQIYWACWNKGHGYPTLLHNDEATARAECERLARKTGQPIHLLEVRIVAMCKTAEPPVRWAEAEQQ